MKDTNFYLALNFSDNYLSDEEKLMLLCSRMEMNKEEKITAEDILKSSTMDWNRFIALADSYSVLPFTYKNLQLYLESIPENSKSALRGKVGRVFARNMGDLDNIKFLVHIFKEGGVDVLFTKGAALMLDIYNGLGLRTFADIDILIKEEDMAKVKGLLEDKGFTEYVEGSTSDRYRSQRVFALGGKLVLDVHVDLMGRRLHNRLQGIDASSIWHTKKKIIFGDMEFYTFDPVHAILYQCMHLAIQHSFVGLLGYVDINEMIRRYKDQIDWDVFLKRAKECRIRRPVYYSLLFTKEMLEAPVPENVLKDLKQVERGLDRWAFKKIRTNKDGTDYLAELVMFDSLWDTLKFTTLSFVSQPKQFTHFFRIFGRIIKEIFTPSERKEA